MIHGALCIFHEINRFSRFWTEVASFFVSDDNGDWLLLLFVDRFQLLAKINEIQFVNVFSRICQHFRNISLPNHWLMVAYTIFPIPDSSFNSEVRCCYDFRLFLSNCKLNPCLLFSLGYFYMNCQVLYIRWCWVHTNHSECLSLNITTKLTQWQHLFLVSSTLSIFHLQLNNLLQRCILSSHHSIFIHMSIVHSVFA